MIAPSLKPWCRLGQILYFPVVISMTLYLCSVQWYILVFESGDVMGHGIVSWGGYRRGADLPSREENFSGSETVPLGVFRANFKG